MRTRTILAAAAAPAIAAAALLATTGAASAATAQPSFSAYYWQPNGHALGGPQAMPGGTTQFSASQGLAKITEKVNNADLTGHQITITGTLTGGPFTDPGQSQGDATAQNPWVRVYFAGGSAGTNATSPDGYMSQSWWANGNGYDTASWQYLNNSTLAFTVTVHIDPAAGWSNWNGQQTTDPATAALFSAAATHVHEIGLSFGGGYFFENGVTGTGTITINSISGV
jgi:hypothetical protein